MSRILSPEGRGEFAVISYFPTLMGALLTLGMPQAVTTLVSKAHTNIDELLTAGFRLSVALALLAAPIFALGAPLSLTGDNHRLATQVALACVCGPFMIITPYFHAMAYGLKRFMWVNRVTIIGQSGYVVSLIGLWFFGVCTPLTAVLSALACQVLQFLIHLLHIRPSCLTASVGRESYKSILRLGWRLAIPSLALVILSNADRALLIRTTTLEQIGYFSTAFALTFPITLTTEAFTQIGFVEISSSDDHIASLQLTLRRFQMSQVVAILCFLLACTVIDPVIRYGFGIAYVKAIPAAYPLALTMCLRAVSRTLENSLRGLNFILPGTLSATVNIAGLVCLSFLWVPRWGAIGFSYASLVSQVLYLASLLAFLATRPSVNPQMLWGLRLSIAGAMTRALWALCKRVEV